VTTWLVDGLRTAFGRFGGALRDMSVVELGAKLLESLTCEVPWLRDQAEELVVGIAMIEGGFMVPARQIAVRASLPESLPTLTVDRACCSGLTATGLAMRGIAAGGRLAIVLGAEVMSRTPRLLHGSRFGTRLGDMVVEDLLLLRSPLAGRQIAAYAGAEALQLGVTREMQDEWAISSHRRYFAARANGYFDEEILPVPGTEGPLEHDEQPRADTSLERLAALPCVYGSPTVTAGNAPGLNDGACALIVGNDDALESAGVRPLARIDSYHQTADSPTSAVWLPGAAIRTLVERAGIRLEDLDVIEVNEAYAATPLASMRHVAGGDRGLEAELLSRTNTNGGAVAIGHPTGASGARIVLTAARRLRIEKGRWAVAAICGGFGQADAVLLENPG
jgi:acetyl-CoA C-acetyltransferase